ncbi:MAG: transposase [Gallionellaceae bacterium]|nr:MAG: transposase [Gallionellaceae bacterium]
MKEIEPAPHSQNLRKGRYSEAGQIYLLTTATWQRRPFFLDVLLGRMVVQAMRFQENEKRVESLAFVLMPDHLHWLLALQNQVTLPEVMKSVKSYSARMINRFLQKTGATEAAHVWQDGFHDHALRKEDDLIEVARYVVANPVRAGLVQRVEDYPLWDAKWL